MGLFSNDNKGLDRWFVEMPDEAKGLLVYKWPDQQLRRRTQVTVDVDHAAVFTSSGKVTAVLGPGRHTLDEGAAPALTAWLTDVLTAEGFYDTELYYVATREVTGVPFGGPVDKVRDRDTELVVDLRVFGDCAIRVVDPAALIAKLAGSRTLGDDREVRDWVSSHVVAAVREESGAMVREHGVLFLGEHQADLEETVAANANTELAGYGLEVVRFAQLNVNVTEDDAVRLERMYEAKGYVDLAGSWEAYTMGEALRNLGGDGGGGGGVAAALLFSQLGRAGGPGPAPAGPAPTGPPPAGSTTGAAASGAACPSCQQPTVDGARFCPSCGASLRCTSCAEPLVGAGMFCAACGAQQPERP